MAGEVILKSFPFDSMQILNEESRQMEDDRLYEAKIFRNYFRKFLSNGVYFGLYKNYGENSMKVILDSGLTVKVLAGAGLINGADFELDDDTLLILERPISGNRIDRIVVKVDDTLAVRDTQLYVKQGNEMTPAELQRDENIYEICIAEVTVKSTSNITEKDIKDTRLDTNLCGIVNSLITVDGKELYERFQGYIDEVTENLVRKDQNSIITGKITAKGGIEGNVTTATKLQNKRSIGLSGGVTGTAIEFDGSSNITIPVTALDISRANTGILPVARGGTGNSTGNAATATKLATARNFELSGAVKGNVSFDGSKNAIINTTQANVAIVTGTVALTNGAGNTNVSYPSGFTRDNSIVIGAQILIGEFYETVSLQNASIISVRLTASNVQMRVNKTSDVGPSNSYNFKILLMKTS